jgi:hypothetical protein
MSQQQHRQPVIEAARARLTPIVAPRHLTPVPLTAAQRWADAVGRLAAAPADVRTLGRWAELVYLTRTTLLRRCEVVGAGAKASLELGRVARTLTLCRDTDWRPQNWLEVDHRTLDKLLRRANLSATGGDRPSLAALLDGFVPSIAPAARAAVERRLASIIEDGFPA